MSDIRLTDAERAAVVAKSEAERRANPHPFFPGTAMANNSLSVSDSSLLRRIATVFRRVTVGTDADSRLLDELKDRLADGRVIDAHAVSDGDDERRRGPLTWVFVDEDQAKDCSKGRGWYGGDSHVVPVHVVSVAGNMHFLGEKLPNPLGIGPKMVEELRRIAMDKLTPFERKLLGVKEQKST